MDFLYPQEALMVYCVTFARKMVHRFGVIVFLLAIGCLNGSFLLHPYHISVSQLDYNSKSRTWQISSSIHDHDMLEFLHHQLKTDAPIEKLIALEKTKELVFAYFTSEFLIFADGKKVDINWIGIDYDLKDVWVYLESKPCDFPKEIVVENKLFLTYYPDQTNMVNVSKDAISPIKIMLNAQHTEESILLMQNK